MAIITNIGVIFQNIYVMFFAWLPDEFQIMWGLVLAVSLIILGMRILKLVWDALPFV